MCLFVTSLILDGNAAFIFPPNLLAVSLYFCFDEFENIVNLTTAAHNYSIIMESHNNYEDYDEMENPDQFTESQRIPSEENPVNGMCAMIEFTFPSLIKRSDILQLKKQWKNV